MAWQVGDELACDAMQVDMKVAALLTQYQDRKLYGLKRGRVTGRALERVLEGLGDRDAGDLLPHDLLPMIDQIAEVAPVNADRTTAYLSAFFNWALKQGHLRSNPLQGVPARRLQRQRRERVLTPGELAAIWDAAGAIDYPFGPVVQLLMLTATRREDVANVRVGDLARPGLRGDVIWTVSTAAEGPRPFVICLSPIATSTLRSALQCRPSGSELIFSTTGTTPISGWSRSKRRLDTLTAPNATTTDERSSTRIPAWRLDDFRRTFYALSTSVLDVPGSVADACLNRKGGFTTPVAREWATSDRMVAQRREAMLRWSEWLQGVVEHEGGASPRSVG